MSAFDDPELDWAIAKFLYIASKDEPPDVAGLYRATALTLIGEKIDADLMREAAKAKTIDDTLYLGKMTATQNIEAIWDDFKRRSAT